MRALTAAVFAFVLFGLLMVLVPTGAFYFFTEPDTLLRFLADREIYARMERETVAWVGLDDEAAAVFFASTSLAEEIQRETERLAPGFLAYLRGESRQLPAFINLVPLRAHIREALSQPEVFMALAKHHNPEEFERLEELPPEERQESIRVLVDRELGDLDIPDTISLAELFGSTQPNVHMGGPYGVLFSFIRFSAQWFPTLAGTAIFCIVLLLALQQGRVFWTLLLVFLPAGIIYILLYVLADRIILNLIIQEMPEDELLYLLMEIPRFGLGLLMQISLLYFGAAALALLGGLLFGRRRRLDSGL